MIELESLGEIDFLLIPANKPVALNDVKSPLGKIQQELPHTLRLLKIIVRGAIKP